ncbi:hypothetical protein NHJ13734_007756 [Beauveria thailandica]
MDRTGIIILRVLQGLLALANLTLAAYVYNWYSRVAERSSPGALQFLVFAPCVSIISVGYLEIAVQQRRMIMAHRLTSMGVEGLNAILYFGGFIAFALTLSDSSTACEAGLSCTLSRAVAVIAAAEFSAWIASTIFAAQEWFQSEAHMKKITAARRQMAEANARL